MGRKRIPEDEKHIRVSISLKKKYADELKKRFPYNVSKHVENLIKDYLKKE